MPTYPERYVVLRGSGNDDLEVLGDYDTVGEASSYFDNVVEETDSSELYGEIFIYYFVVYSGDGTKLVKKRKVKGI